MKLIRPLPLLLLCALLLAGCGQGGGAPQEQETAQTQTGPTWESRTPSEAFQGIQGCAVLYDLGTDHYTLYQEDLCRTQVSPCSTFKIISTLMGLHTGVLTGPESTMTYSGIQYPVAAVLPAGTLSGAPKIRACQRIGQLEGNKRGIYGGAIGYLDFTGNLDTCIAIRIAYQKNGRVFVRSGAGIVADSVPETEYEECLNKAKAVMRALELAQEVEP